MKILFSPSEAKHKGGDSDVLKKEYYIFEGLFDKRMEFINHYNDFVLNASDEELATLFGTKKIEVINYYKKDIFRSKGKKVIERYDGVAYDYLDYKSLTNQAKSYIEQNTIIFSNLFGPLGAGDLGLPEYRLQQTQKVGDIAPEKFYKEHFTKALDDLLSKEPYLDLRAGFYDKFYKPNSTYTTLKFIKNGKVVSHWAKAYRGIVLRNMAINDIKSIEVFMSMEIENLTIKEILKKGIHTQIIYEII